MLPMPSPPYALGSALARFSPKPKLITEDPGHQHKHMASGLRVENRAWKGAGRVSQRRKVEKEGGDGEGRWRRKGSTYQDANA